MGLMEAMTRYTKKDPYEEALVQLDKKDPDFAKFLRHVAKKTGNKQLALEQVEGMLVEYRKFDAQRQNADRIGECRERRACYHPRPSGPAAPVDLPGRAQG